MIEVLIDSLMEYKTQMSYKGIDFDGDKPMQYKEIRLMMAKIYSEDISIFGPLSVDQLPDGFNEMSKEEKAEAKELVKISKELIAKGTKRVMEKVKEIRQAFSKAVISGTRSGSGKIVFEFYDKLVLLWGGSANVTLLNRKVILTRMNNYKIHLMSKMLMISLMQQHCHWNWMFQHCRMRMIILRKLKLVLQRQPTNEKPIVCHS
jgi:hypothetical protein